MAEQEKKISVNMIAEKTGVSPSTIMQLCETGQIPEKCYVDYDREHRTWTRLFYPSLTIKAIRQWEKEEAQKEADRKKQLEKEKKAKKDII